MRAMARILFERQQDDDTARAFADLAEELRGAPECAPPLDVIEYADRVEIVVDLPGVAVNALRVIYARGSVVVMGRKLPRVCSDSVAFHLAERSFGRFARAVTLSGAIDAGRASASLAAGVLRIALPRIEERRGRDIEIAVAAP